MQFLAGDGYKVNNIWYFLFCDWKTGWTLLYKPIVENEGKEVDEIIKVNEFLYANKSKLKKKELLLLLLSIQIFIIFDILLK
jgi:hypothetical protein